MKILLINNHGEPNDGASIISLMFRENLRQRGHDARLFASNASFANRSDGADYRCFGTHSGLQMLLQPANPSAYRQLRRALADFKPDVVHVRTFLWQMSPLILPLLRHVPSLYHVVSYKAICPLGTKMLPDGRSCEVSAGPACFQNGCLPLRIWPLMMLQQKLCRRWGHVFNLVVATSEAVRQRLMQERSDSQAFDPVPFIFAANGRLRWPSYQGEGGRFAAASLCNRSGTVSCGASSHSWRRSGTRKPKENRGRAKDSF
jgi:hypothetical protein